MGCATAWNDGIALVSRRGAPGCLPASGGSCSPRIPQWASADGATWQEQPGYADPFLVCATHCASLAGRLFLYGGLGGPSFGGGMVSSADPSSWRFEPCSTYGEVAPGMAVSGGRLHLLLGTGSTHRPAMRSDPPL